MVILMRWTHPSRSIGRRPRTPEVRALPLIFCIVLNGAVLSASASGTPATEVGALASCCDHSLAGAAKPFWPNLLDTSDFRPRWHCGQWSPGLGWTHIVADLAIW